MGRSILAVLTGIISSVILITLINSFGNFFYAGYVPRDVSEVNDALEVISQTALFFVLGVWVLGSFTSGLVAALIAKKNATNHALIAGLGLLLLGVLYVLIIPHPIWFSLVGLMVMLPFAYLGGEVPGKNNTY